jgi:hypothetical protein
MMRTVQLAMVDERYVAALREALSHSGPWQVMPVDCPDFGLPSVVVVDELAFAQLPLPLANPERVVLVARPDRDALAHAWDAGIVSVVSTDDPLPTVLLAIMAVALRVPTVPEAALPGAISPNPAGAVAPIGPPIKIFRPKHCKIH